MTFGPQYQPQRPQQPPQQAWPPRQQQPQYPQQMQPYYGQPYPQQWQPPPYPQAAPPPNAALIVILSFLVPGLGSIVGRSYVHGSIILAAFLLSALSLLVGIGLILVPVTWIWGMIAACVLASRR